jgi:hypothetical protein
MNLSAFSLLLWGEIAELAVGLKIPEGFRAKFLFVQQAFEVPSATELRIGGL